MHANDQGCSRFVKLSWLVCRQSRHLFLHLRTRSIFFQLPDLDLAIELMDEGTEAAGESMMKGIPWSSVQLTLAHFAVCP